MKILRLLRRTLTQHQLIHQRLKRRLVLFPLIGIGMFIFAVGDAIPDGISPVWIIPSGLIGIGVGYLVAHIYKIYWREDQQKIVSGIDRMAVFLIILYVALRIASDQLAGEFIHGKEFTIVTFSFLGGLLIGRMIGVLLKVIHVLESQTVLDHIRNARSKKLRP